MKQNDESWGYPVDDLEAALRHTYPGSEPDVPVGLLTSLAEEVAVPRVIPLRRRVAGVTAAVVAAAVLVPGGIAAAALGWQALTNENHIFDDSDAPVKTAEPAIDPCASDFPAYAASLPAPNTSPPPGFTWGELATQAARREQAASEADCASHGVMMGVTGVRTATTFEGLYRWQCLAITRAEAGDHTGAREAGANTADLYEELNTLGIWGDGSWLSVRDAARTLDLGVLTRDSAANSTVPCP